MKTIYFILLSMAFSAAFAEEGVCQKCQRIREYNASHPENNYYWYDDYLKEKGNPPQEKTSDDQKNVNPTK